MDDENVLGGAVKKPSPFMKTLKKGLASSAESMLVFGGKELAKCLAKKLGWVSKREQQLAAYQEWMKSVTYDLTIIDQKVDALTKEVNDGFKDLKTGELYQAYSAQKSSLINYTTDIDHAFNQLKKILQTDYKSEKAVADDIANLENYVGFKMLDSTHNMAKVWGAFDFSDTRSLMENWTDSCILSAGGNVDGLERYYDSLERNFQLASTYLFKAYTVLTAITNYKNEPNAEKSDPQTITWLEQEVTKYCKPIAETFVNCVERLILSTYHPDLDPKKVVFGAPEAVDYIGSRSQLLLYLMVDMDEKKTAPGLIAKQYLRPSMFTTGKSKMFATETAVKNTTYELEGTRWLPFEKYYKRPLMKNWYKAIDRNSNGELIPFEDSDIIIMNYNRPFKTGENEFELTSDIKIIFGGKERIVKKNTAYKYYDPETLAIIDKNAEGAIALAYVAFTDFISNISYEAYNSLSNMEAQANQYTFDSHNKDELGKHAIKESIVVDGPYGKDPVKIMSVKCAFLPPVFATDHNLGFWTKYPIRYSAKNKAGAKLSSLSGKLSDEVRLILVNKMQSTVFITNYTNGNSRKCDIKISIYAKKQDNSKLNYYTRTYKNNTNFGDEAILFSDSGNGYMPTQSAFLSESQIGVPLIPGQATVLEWEVELRIQGLHVGAYSQNTDVKGELKAWNRLAWPQPIPGFY